MVFKSNPTRGGSVTMVNCPVSTIYIIDAYKKGYSQSEIFKDLSQNQHPFSLMIEIPTDHDVLKSKISRAVSKFNTGGYTAKSLTLMRRRAAAIAARVDRQPVPSQPVQAPVIQSTITQAPTINGYAVELAIAVNDLIKQFGVKRVTAAVDFVSKIDGGNCQ